eukprot:gene17809-biopygen6002
MPPVGNALPPAPLMPPALPPEPLAPKTTLLMVSKARMTGAGNGRPQRAVDFHGARGVSGVRGARGECTIVQFSSVQSDAEGFAFPRKATAGRRGALKLRRAAEGVECVESVACGGRRVRQRRPGKLAEACRIQVLSGGCGVRGVPRSTEEYAEYAEYRGVRGVRGVPRSTAEYAESAEYAEYAEYARKEGNTWRIEGAECRGWPRREAEDEADVEQDEVVEVDEDCETVCPAPSSDGGPMWCDAIAGHRLKDTDDWKFPLCRRPAEEAAESP